MRRNSHPRNISFDSEVKLCDTIKKCNMRRLDSISSILNNKHTNFLKIFYRTRWNVIVSATFTGVETLVSPYSVNVKNFFLNYGKWTYGRYGRTYWKISCEPRGDIYFKLAEHQPFRGMVPILVWYKNVRMFFNFHSFCSLFYPVGGVLKKVITVSFSFD